MAANSEERIAELGKLLQGKIQTDWSLLDEADREPFDELMGLLGRRESVVACMQAAKRRGALEIYPQFAPPRCQAAKPRWRSSIESIVRHLASFWVTSPRRAEASTMPIKVLLADDMPVVRRAIRGLLEYEPGLEVVGEAADFGQTVQMARELKPQVVILDLHMPDEDKFTPLDIRSHLSDAASRLVAISAWNDQDAKALAESFGAVTLLDKVDLGNTLIPAITRMAYNKRFFAIGNRSKA